MCRPSTSGEGAADALVLPPAPGALAGADPGRREARRVLRSRARAPAGVAQPGPRRDRGGGQERHGQDHAVQRDHRARAGLGQRAAGRGGDPWAAAQRHHRSRGGLRPAGPAPLAFAHGGRAPAPRLARPLRRLDGGARVPDLPAARGAKGQRGRRALRRRAADARHRAGAPLQPDPPRDGRADRGPGARDRAAGGRDAEASGRRRRDLGAADRAEPRGGDRGRRHRRRHGQRPHRALDAVGRARGRPRPAAASARRQGGPGRGAWRRPGAGRGRRGPAGHGHRLYGEALERRCGDGARTGGRAARRAGRARLHALERRGSPERAARPADRRARGPGRSGAVAG